MGTAVSKSNSWISSVVPSSVRILLGLMSRYRKPLLWILEMAVAALFTAAMLSLTEE